MWILWLHLFWIFNYQNLHFITVHEKSISFICYLCGLNIEWQISYSFFLFLNGLLQYVICRNKFCIDPRFLEQLSQLTQFSYSWTLSISYRVFKSKSLGYCPSSFAENRAKLVNCVHTLVKFWSLPSNFQWLPKVLL